MGKKDPRVDAYIAKSPDFAKPILRHVREIVHKGCPDVEETIKWGMPHFDYKGMLCGMSAFKKHCALGFWKHRLVVPAKKGAMGHFGRIISLKDLPPDRVLVGYVREAARSNEAGMKVPRKRREPKRALATPADLAAALKKNAKARAAFEEFSPSHRREYIEWITEAKTEETRRKRLGTAVEWMAEGKPRNWKYMRQGTRGAL
jgi:uncharacterized protein YdeI (YjbR/CyaY-like superfamily)